MPESTLSGYALYGKKETDLYLYLALVRSFYELHAEKRIDEQSWKKWKKWFNQAFLRHDAFKDFWGINKKYYDKDFVDYINI